MTAGLLRPGQSCWRVERASRVALMVDASAYFDALVRATARAERSVLMVGWDFHTEANLRPSDDGGPPLTLAGHLNAITAANPELEVHILCWDYSPILLMERELLPLVQFHWKTDRRVHFRLASNHPVGASHHQKVVVIDDRLAFVGGLDLTIARWDEPSHTPDDVRRRLPNGDPYGAFHDVQVAVDGDAARALGELVRRRWAAATRVHLEPPIAGGDPWPAGLRASMRDVDVGIARTQPAHSVYAPVHEVERLYLDAIAAARDRIYIENQYVTSHRIERALRERLAEPGGPEVVLVTPRTQSGRLEQVTMGAIRARLVRALRAADREDRLRVLCPVVDGAEVNVHAKVMIVDDTFVRVGSANLSARSMRLDTECDLAIEAGPDDAASRQAIVELRATLLSEHLGAVPSAVRDAIAEGGLRSAIDRLGGGRRALVPLDVDDAPALGVEVPDDVVDPEQPLDEALVRHAVPDEASEAGARHIVWRVAVAAVPLALLGLWLWTPIDPAPARPTRDSPYFGIGQD